jgi:hypothetical protein
MKRVLALACAVLGLTAGAAAAGELVMPRPVGVAIGEPTGWPPRSGDVLVVDGWRLPVTHAYQAQDDYGVYHPVRPADVPLTIARGKEVYDLTAQAWVNHPTAYAATLGRNPAYVAVETADMSGPAVVVDGWRLPTSHAYQAQDDYGVYHPVRPADVPLAILRGKEVYDLTARAWVNHPTAYAATGGRNPAYVAAAVSGGRDGWGGSRDGWGGRRDGWDELRGRIERIDRERLTLRTDDGRRVVVDTSDARMTFRPDRGDRVVALGTNGRRGEFDARYVAEERPAR